MVHILFNEVNNISVVYKNIIIVISFLVNGFFRVLFVVGCNLFYHYIMSCITFLCLVYFVQSNRVCI